jgi:hypothetical protein
MPVFELQKAITTDTPSIEVAGILKPGIYRFQLFVIDAQGNASAPMDRDITIVATPQSPPIIASPILDRPPFIRLPTDRPPIPRVPIDRVPIRPPQPPLQ